MDCKQQRRIKLQISWSRRLVKLAVFYWPVLLTFESSNGVSGRSSQILSQFSAAAGFRNLFSANSCPRAWSGGLMVRRHISAVKIGGSSPSSIV